MPRMNSKTTTASKGGSKMAPSSSPRAMPKPVMTAPTSSKRPMSAAPARAVRAGQAMLDRSARLGDSGPKGLAGAMKSSRGGMKKGYMSGGSVKGGSGCKTY